MDDTATVAEYFVSFLTYLFGKTDQINVMAFLMESPNEMKEFEVCA